MSVSPEVSEKQIKINKPLSTEQILGIRPRDRVHLRKDRIIQVLMPGPNLYDKKEKRRKKLSNLWSLAVSLKNVVKIQQERPGKLELIR